MTGEIWRLSQPCRRRGFVLAPAADFLGASRTDTSDLAEGVELFSRHTSGVEAATGPNCGIVIVAAHRS